ncbi:hypothetical protein WJX79_007020 [Trebouxia sp. C0005]
MSTWIEDQLQQLMSPVTAATLSYTGPTLSALPGLTSLFAAVFAAAYVGWGLYGLSGKRRATLSSCVISIVHGIVTNIIAGAQLVSQYPFSLDAQNTSSVNFVMQLSAAYMIVDFFLFLLPFTPNDFLFVGHHMMTTGYMMSSLYIGRGGLSCLVLMVLGESTSLFQNSWLISRELRRESRAAMSCFKVLSPIYTYVFLLVRSIVAPPVIAWFCVHLQSAQKLPIGCRVTWAALAAVTTAGSQIWSYKLWKGLKKQSAKHKADVMHRPKSM